MFSLFQGDVFVPTIAEALYCLPTERLRALSTLREIDSRRIALATDKRQLVQFMAAELNKPPSSARAVLRCNARELRLLQLMLSLDGRQSVAWRAVVDAAGGPAISEPLSAVLDGIERLGLAFRAGDQVLLLESMRHQVPTSLADNYSVSGCLHNYDAPTLRRIAEGLGTGGGTKAENIDAIARRLLYADEEMFGPIQLDREEVSVLNYIVQSGGGATAVEVASAVLGNTDDFFRYDWQNRWKSGRAKNAIDRLLARGMIYVVSYAYGFNLFLVVPGDLLRAITGESRAAFWTSPIPVPRAAEPEPTATSRHTGLTRDVVAFFGYISTQEAPRTNTGFMHKSALKHIARTLSQQNERYAAFLYALCRQAGLIGIDQERHAYGVTPAGRAWLTKTPAEQVHALFSVWQKGDFWGEMYDEPLKRGNEYRPIDSVISVRQAALDLVALQSGETFIELGSLTDALNFRCPLLLAQSTQFGDELVPSPANFIRLLIGECLYWLGLAELGWDADAQRGLVPDESPIGKRRSPRVTDETENGAQPLPRAFRLTPMGGLLLGVTGAAPPDEAPSETEFILQANAEIFIPPFLDGNTLFHLMMITETAGKGQSGSIVTLTRESIRRALDQGIAGQEIIDFLRTHTRTGIPQNVEYLINEVSVKHGHIHLGRAQMYIQVDSPLVLKELQARRELKNYFVRTLGDTVAILNAAEPDKLLKELRKAGYLPISDDAPRSQNVKFGTPAPSSERTDTSVRLSKAGKTAPAADTPVDWEAFAEQDGRPWTEAVAPQPEAQPQDAVRDKSNIRFLLLDAIRSATRVQLAYQNQGELAAQIRVIEPYRVMGNFVVAYLPLEGVENTLNINRIVWATATKEAFAPPQ